MTDYLPPSFAERRGLADEAVRWSFAYGACLSSVAGCSDDLDTCCLTYRFDCFDNRSDKDTLDDASYCPYAGIRGTSRFRALSTDRCSVVCGPILPLELARVVYFVREGPSFTYLREEIFVRH